MNNTSENERIEKRRRRRDFEVEGEIRWGSFYFFFLILNLLDSLDDDDFEKDE